MAVFHFDPEAHVYTLDGVRLPSVTQLLKPIGPDFSAVLPGVLERKRALGVAVHLACELDDNGELEELDDALLPYLQAWRKFKAECSADILENERQEFHAGLRFAGTIDRLAELRLGSGLYSRWLLDIKTSAEPHASYGVQLAGYQRLLHLENEKIQRGTVHLRDDGTYRLHEFKNPNDMGAFMACLSLHHWKEANQ